jgi:hypothetical protein
MKKLTILIFLTLFGFGSVKAAEAEANITLSPSTKTIAVNEFVDASVILDTGGAASSGSDFILVWSPASALEIQEASHVSYGSTQLFTSNTPSRDNTNGKVISISTMSVATSTFSGKGTLATIKFKAKAAGTVTLTFECASGSRSDTNVWSSGSDIINCDQTTGAKWTITPAGTVTTPAPTSRSIGATGSAETKGGLPNSGAFEVTLALGLGGFLLLGFGLFFPRLLRN